MVSAGRRYSAKVADIILATNLGERVMQPSFGCGIKSQVYENINESTLTVLKDLMGRAILFYEPRVKLESITADRSQAYEGRLDFLISYTVIATNTRHNIVTHSICARAPMFRSKADEIYEVTMDDT